MQFDWDDIVWSEAQRCYLWADGTRIRVVKGVELDANSAVEMLRYRA